MDSWKKRLDADGGRQGSPGNAHGKNKYWKRERGSAFQSQGSRLKIRKTS
jgi:hypothetical protein